MSRCRKRPVKKKYNKASAKRNKTGKTKPQPPDDDSSTSSSSASSSSASSSNDEQSSNSFAATTVSQQQNDQQNDHNNHNNDETQSRASGSKEVDTFADTSSKNNIAINNNSDAITHDDIELPLLHEEHDNNETSTQNSNNIAPAKTTIRRRSLRQSFHDRFTSSDEDHKANSDSQSCTTPPSDSSVQDAADEDTDVSNACSSSEISGVMAVVDTITNMSQQVQEDAQDDTIEESKQGKSNRKEKAARYYKQEVDFHIAKAEADKYSQAYKTYYADWTPFIKNILLSNLAQTLLSYAFTHCKWNVRDVKYDAQVLALKGNAQWSNPYLTNNLNHLPQLPSPSDCPKICTVRFKGCNSPCCCSRTGVKKEKVTYHGDANEKCIANIKVEIFNTTPATCTVYVTGRHHSSFFPNQNNIQIGNIITAMLTPQEIVETSTQDAYAKLQRLQEMQQKAHGSLSVPLISRKLYSNVKARLKRKLQGSHEDDYKLTLERLQEIISRNDVIDIVDTSGTLMSAHEMTIDNFVIILCNKTMLQLHIEQVQKKVAMDSNYKLYRFKNEQKQVEKTVLTFISIETSELNPIVIFAMVSSSFTAIHLSAMYESVSHYMKRYLDARQVNSFVWSPLWMIDKGSVEIAFMAEREQRFIICKFHAVKIWWEWLKTHSCQEEYKQEVRKYFYDLYNCNSQEEYLSLYDEFIENKLVPQTFKAYYNENWHDKGNFEINGKTVPFYYFWTSILRESSFGSYSTDNINEIKFAALSKSIKRPHRKYFTRLNVSISNLQAFMKEDAAKTRWQKYNNNPEVRRMTNNMKGYESYTVEPKEGVGKFIAYNPERKVTRQCDLYNMKCSCSEFAYSGRPCAHLFAAIMNVAKTENWKLASAQPFHILHLAHVWFHDKKNFQSVCTQVQLAMPTIGPKREKQLSQLKKATRVADNNENDGSTEVYEIEAVVGIRYGPNNALQVLVKWKEYSSAHNDWALCEQSNSLFTTNFCMKFCQWFKKQFNTRCIASEQYVDAINICSLYLNDSHQYRCNIGTNSEAVTQYGSNIVVSHVPALVKLFKSFGYTPK